MAIAGTYQVASRERERPLSVISRPDPPGAPSEQLSPADPLGG